METGDCQQMREAEPPQRFPVFLREPRAIAECERRGQRGIRIDQSTRHRRTLPMERPSQLCPRTRRTDPDPQIGRHGRRESAHATAPEPLGGIDGTRVAPAHHAPEPDAGADAIPRDEPAKAGRGRANVHLHARRNPPLDRAGLDRPHALEV
ncbi:MAG: hypothetical protein OEP95_12200 [Myxococcales bacterium]|nr:hypothetical protein [Myxococcales bacterium]